MTERENVWGYLRKSETLGDKCDVNRGVLDDADRPWGDCWACVEFADEALVHESPGTANCCKGCDAYKGAIANE